MLRLVVGALLLVLAFAGGYAVAACKTVTLTVDGTAMRVTTMKSRVIDIVEENGFSVDDRDDLYPAAGVQVHDADTIVLRRSRPLQISLDGHDAKQVWTTASDWLPTPGWWPSVRPESTCTGRVAWTGVRSRTSSGRPLPGISIWPSGPVNR